MKQLIEAIKALSNLILRNNREFKDLRLSIETDLNEIRKAQNRILRELKNQPGQLTETLITSSNSTAGNTNTPTFTTKQTGPTFKEGSKLDLLSKIVTFEEEPITESVADSSFISGIDFKSKMKNLNNKK